MKTTKRKCTWTLGKTTGKPEQSNDLNGNQLEDLKKKLFCAQHDAKGHGFTNNIDLELMLLYCDIFIVP